MAVNVRLLGKHKVNVLTPDEYDKVVLTPEDREMDERVAAAVSSAIKKAIVCKAPIAKYDMRKKKAYIVRSNGDKEYVS